MTAGALAEIPAPYAYRPNLTYREEVLESMKAVGHDAGLKVAWTNPTFTGISLIGAYEIRQVLTTEGIVLDEAAASKLGDVIYDALPDSADRPQSLPGMPLEIVEVGRSRPYMLCLALGNTVLEEERAVARRAVEEFYGLTSPHPLWIANSTRAKLARAGRRNTLEVLQGLLYARGVVPEVARFDVVEVADA